MNLEDLHWQQPLAWEDCQARLWLSDNLASFDEMAEFVFETEEFKNTIRKVDEALNSAAHNPYYDYRPQAVECGGDFYDWLCAIGGNYIQDFEAQKVLTWAVEEELAKYGYTVDRESYPVAIMKPQR